MSVLITLDLMTLQIELCRVLLTLFIFGSGLIFSVLISHFKTSRFFVGPVVRIYLSIYHPAFPLLLYISSLFLLDFMPICVGQYL